jgi:hypothetical protein
MSKSYYSRLSPNYFEFKISGSIKGDAKCFTAVEIAQHLVGILVYSLKKCCKNYNFQPLSLYRKGPRHEIFDVWFFHQTTPLRPLIHGLKPFWICLRIREENRLRNRWFLSPLWHAHTQRCQWRIRSFFGKGFNPGIRDPYL